MLRSAGMKHVLGALPWAAELDWSLRGKGKPVGGFKLEELREALPEWCAQVRQSPLLEAPGKKILLFATLHYWIGHAMLTALAFRGMGHEVTLATLPYANWQKGLNKFDARKRELYIQEVLAPASDLIEHVSFAQEKAGAPLAYGLAKAVEQVSLMDAQYSLQVEEVDLSSQLYQMRLGRNSGVASEAQRWIAEEKPDVVITPNGLILEFGAVFHAAKQEDVPVVSYEFGEQRERIWLAQDNPVMIQDTDAMWAGCRELSFDDDQRQKVAELFSTRQQADLFQNFYRRWQEVPSEGAQQVREKLGLDERPIVLLAANVIGDSLTLGRATFSGDMSSWLRRTLSYFFDREDVQFVLRVHPGERNLEGPSVAELVTEALPELPGHMRVVQAEDPINTYDLIAAADLGLVYTTTVGMEMAMSGLPVIVVGQTHYRAKGFTQNPESWEEYFSLLDKNLAKLETARLSKQEVDTAWHYAYCFFFDYPQTFPWHLLHFWEDVKNYSLETLFSAKGQAQYRSSFDYLSGESFDWDGEAQ